MNRFAIVCSFPGSSVSVLYYESELLLDRKNGKCSARARSTQGGLSLARRANIVGYFSLIGLVISWVAQSEVAQYLETHLEYRKLTLITYINHSFSVLLLPLLWIAHVLSTGHWSGLARSLAADGLTGRRAVVASVQLGTIYLFGDLLWYIGLAFTSVAAGTAIFNSSCALTFIMSALVLRTRVSLKSVAAIAFTLGGVVAVSLAPSKSTGGSNSTAAAATATPAAPSPLLGNVLYLLPPRAIPSTRWPLERSCGGVVSMRTASESSMASPVALGCSTS